MRKNDNHPWRRSLVTSPLCLFVMLTSLLLLMGCKEEVDHRGKHPIVQVGDAFLYEEDLLRVVPIRLIPEDSVEVTRRFIRTWVEEQLLYDKAKHNVGRNNYIERMVDNYRRSLILQEYQRRLIEQKLNETLTEEDLKVYYEANKQLFVLEEPVVKGVFIKAPLSCPGLKEMKRWYKDNSEEAMERLEKSSYRNAAIYDYFYDYWMPLMDLNGKLPFDLMEVCRHPEKNKNIEVKDEEFCYLLHIDEYVAAGKVKPFDLARKEIHDMLVNHRQVNFMDEVKQDLYNQALKRGRVKYFNDETMYTVADSMRVSVADSTAEGTR